MPISSPTRSRRRKADPGDADAGGVLLSRQPRCSSDPASPVDAEEDPRFSDSLVRSLADQARMYRRWLKARNALILQAKAHCRAFTKADKDAANRLFERLAKDDPTVDPMIFLSVGVYLEAIRIFDGRIQSLERDMEAAAKKLPIAPFVKEVSGLGWKSVALIVGEAGDFSQYRSARGLYKRLGLGVLTDRDRKVMIQRRVAGDPDMAVTMGYSPYRRSVAWNLGEALARRQREWPGEDGEPPKKIAGPYGEILASAKAKALAAGLKPLHAERRAKRFMTKVLLRDLRAAWRGAVGQSGRSADSAIVGHADRPFPIAAE